MTAVLFEDPPFISTEPGRYAESFNYHDLAAPAHAFLRQRAVTDFPSWYIEHNAWIGYIGRGADKVIAAVQRQRRRFPDRPLRLWFFPPVANETLAYLHLFDPEFADALPDGTLVRVDTGHGFHAEDPTAFVTLMRRLSRAVR